MTIAEAEHREEIAETVLRQPRAQHHEEISRMPLQRFHRRVALDLAARHHGFGEDRRFRNLQANVDADHDQQEACEERHAPAPRHQVFARQQGHQRERAGGEQIADGDAERRKAAPEAAMLWWRVLDQEDHRAAIFGAGSQSLHDAHRDQQRRRPVADLRIGRQQADQRGADADHQQRRHQNGFTPEAVAHDAEQDAAERPHHEADAEGQERQQRADHGIAFGKEQLAEHQCGGGAVQEEVVPFERGPDTGRQDHTQARAIVSLGCDLRHRFPPF